MRFLYSFALGALPLAAARGPGGGAGGGSGRCKPNPVLSILQQFHASEFCLDFNKVPTSTSTFVVTNTATVVVTGTSTEVDTSFIDLQATAEATVVSTDVSVILTPASTSTHVVTTCCQGTVTQTITSGVSTTTTTTTTYLYAHNGGGPVKRAVYDTEDLIARHEKRGSFPRPAGLASIAESVLSSACSKYLSLASVPPPHTVVTSTASAAVTTATGVVETDVITLSTVTGVTTLYTTVETVVSTVLSSGVSVITTTLTTPFTSTVTVPSTTTTTTSVIPTNAGTFQYVQSYSTNCVANRYQDFESGLSFPNFDAAFNYCAYQCKHLNEANHPQNAVCSEVLIAYDNSDGTSSQYDCQWGGGDATYTWDSSHVQCNLTPQVYKKYSVWYSAA